MTDAMGFKKIITEVISAREDLKQVNQENALGDSAVDELLLKVPHQIRLKVDRKSFNNNQSSIETLTFLTELCEEQQRDPLNSVSGT